MKESNAIGSRKLAVAYPAILHLYESHGIKVTSQKFQIAKFWRSKVEKKPGQIDLTMLIIPTGTFAIGDSPVDGPTLQCVSCAKKDSLRGTIMMA